MRLQPQWVDASVFDVQGMRVAVHRAKLAVKVGDWPFGCVILRPDGSVWHEATTGGTGNKDDPTHHSEIQSIRRACHARRGHGLLEGFTLISTHEPCPMCCGAINHAKISRVVWGSFRADLPEIFRPKLPAEFLLGDTSHPPALVSGVLRQECIDLFKGMEKWD